MRRCSFFILAAITFSCVVTASTHAFNFNKFIVKAGQQAIVKVSNNTKEPITVNGFSAATFLTGVEESVAPYHNPTSLTQISKKETKVILPNSTVTYTLPIGDTAFSTTGRLMSYYHNKSRIPSHSFLDYHLEGLANGCTRNVMIEDYPGYEGTQAAYRFREVNSKL